MPRSTNEPKGNCLPRCEVSIMDRCLTCGQKAQVYAETSMCIHCMTGESEGILTEPFVVHDIDCPNLEVAP